MQKTAKALGLVVIAVLLVSIGTQIFELSYASANVDRAQNAAPSMALDYGNYGLVEHKISAAELQAYQDRFGSYHSQTYSHTTADYGTGLTAPSSSEWIDIAENGYIVEAVTNQATPPAAVDLSLSPYFPPIGDQVNQGSCASFAVGYYCKTYQEAKEHNWDLSGARWTGGDNDGNITQAYQSKVMSPAFLYNLINTGSDVGSDFETPIRLVSNVGICSWEKMPYYWQDYTRWPTEDAWAEAPLYRANSTYSYQYLYANTSQGVESLKNWLAAGNLAIVGIDAIDNLWKDTGNSIALNSQDLITTDTYTFSGLNHAATIVGYDDLFTYVENGTVQHGAVKIANTWGKGSWENIPDGCYWISYAALQNRSTPDNPVVLFQDQTNYKPQLLASFNITHPSRGDCNITFGLGTPQAPIVTKNFTNYVSGGNHAFCPNNIIFDLTDFSSYLSSQYNQPFFMQVYDKGTDQNGEAATGTINYFAVGNTSSTQAPLATVNGRYVNLTLTTSFAPTTFSASPSNGSSSEEVTLNGVGFEGNTVSISYYNPIDQQWVPVINDYAIATNFSYTFHTPDLLQCNPAGDNTPGSDTLVFRVQDGSNTYTTAFTEWRRGLSQVGDQTATGLYGNSTDLSTSVFVQNGQQLIVAGQWFKPGTATIYWDNLNVGTSTIDQSGSFNTTLTVPATTAGQHTIIASDGVINTTVTVTRLPTVTTNFADSWHTGTLIIDLTADYPTTEIYYRINNGQTSTVTGSGYPTITTEDANNTLEYWGTWSVYGTGNMELSHTTITGIKIDQTPPAATIRINGGAATTTSSSVTLSLNAADSTSGIKQVRFSNDGSWGQTAWEPYVSSKTWQLTSGTGQKMIYCQIQNNAGQTTTVASTIKLTAPQTTATPTASPTPDIPEFSAQLFILLLAILTTSTLIALKTRKQ